MVVLIPFSQPTEGIRHEQPDTTAYVNNNNLGKGTLYITESKFTWISTSGDGFSIDYPHISLHAVSRDLVAHPQECLYLMLNISLDDKEYQEENEDDSENEEMTELYFIPDDKGMLDAMFHAMNHCQSLHPDPVDSYSEDEDFYEDADEEFHIEETDSQMANLNLGQNGNAQHNGDSEDAEMDPGCYEDADD